MSSSPIDRRVKRVENDITAIYDMIGDVQAVQGQHSAELTRIHAKLLDHDARFDAVDARFEAVDTRLEAVDTRLGSIESRLGSIDSAVTELLRRVPEVG